MSNNLPESSGFAEIERQADMILKSGLAPQAIKTREQLIATALKGREAGVPIMQALAHIHIIQGVPTMSAELMAGLARRAGHKVRILETGSTAATVQGVREDDPEYPLSITYTIEEAEQAGLLKNPVWNKYRPAMLRARATAALCRALFSDVLGGISYVPEEAGESGFDQLAPPYEPTPEAVEYGELDPDRHHDLMFNIRHHMEQLGESAPSPEQVYPYAEQSTAKAERTLDQLRNNYGA